MSTAQNQDFATLLKDYFAKLPRVNEIIKGAVISVDNGAIRIDINGLATGVVRGRELYAESKQYGNLKVGAEVEATVLELENENGEMELSFRSAGHQKVWDNMLKSRDENISVEAKILAANKGGLMVQVDALTGFMPVSQLAPENYPRVPGGDKNRILEHLKGLIGQTLQVKVLDAHQKDEKLIVSEKAVWEDEQKVVLDKYNIGDEVEGEVSALTTFGAFIKFGTGLEGLVHISEIAWQRIDHPKDVLKVGDKVKAQIIDLNKSKIYLSIKRLIDDPWKHVKEKYTIGEKVEGEVHKVEPFGIMIKLDEQIHGLAHISELANRPIKSTEELRDLFPIGSRHAFEIVSIEPAEHRLGLRLHGIKSRSEKQEEKAPKSEPKEEDAPKSDAPEASVVEEAAE